MAYTLLIGTDGVLSEILSFDDPETLEEYALDLIGRHIWPCKLTFKQEYHILKCIRSRDIFKYLDKRFMQLGPMVKCVSTFTGFSFTNRVELKPIDNEQVRKVLETEIWKHLSIPTFARLLSTNKTFNKLDVGQNWAYLLKRDFKVDYEWEDARDVYRICINIKGRYDYKNGGPQRFAKFWSDHHNLIKYLKQKYPNVEYYGGCTVQYRIGRMAVDMSTDLLSCWIRSNDCGLERSVCRFQIDLANIDYRILEYLEMNVPNQDEEIHSFIPKLRAEFPSLIID